MELGERSVTSYWDAREASGSVQEFRDMLEPLLSVGQILGKDLEPCTYYQSCSGNEDSILECSPGSV